MYFAVPLATVIPSGTVYSIQRVAFSPKTGGSGLNPWVRIVKTLEPAAQSTTVPVVVARRPADAKKARATDFKENISTLLTFFPAVQI